MPISALMLSKSHQLGKQFVVVLLSNLSFGTYGYLSDLICQEKSGSPFGSTSTFGLSIRKGRAERELSSSGDQLVSVVAVWCGLTPTLTTTEKEEEDCYLGSVRAPQNRYYRNLVPIFVFVLQLLEYLVDIGRLLYYYVLLPCTFFFQPGSPKEVLLTSMASQRHAQPLFSEGIS